MSERTKARIVKAREGATFMPWDTLKCPCGTLIELGSDIGVYWEYLLSYDCECGREIAIGGGVVDFVEKRQPLKPVG